MFWKVVLEWENGEMVRFYKCRNITYLLYALPIPDEAKKKIVEIKRVKREPKVYTEIK